MKKNQSPLSEGEMLKHLESLGYTLVKSPKVTDTKIKVDLSRFRGRRIRFAVCGDTHLGSIYQQLTYLHSFYRYCQRRKIDLVFNLGDILDGCGIRAFEAFKFLPSSADAYVDYALAHYPKVKGIETYCISGNHDLTYLKLVGYDPIRRLAELRSDFHYLGQSGAMVEIDGLKIYLLHPDGGVSYARSYKLQKIIESFAPQNKPNILLVGHWHQQAAMWYRNVYGCLVGCFQSQTDYMKRKGMAADVGGFVFEVTTNDADIPNGVARIRTEWIPFPKTIEDDY